VATIDNYQGEESDVVIASLVRSNNNGDIGFVGDKNRINVLLSRARHGMILIGNETCLQKAKSKQARDLWSEVFRLLKQDSSIHTSFPAKCATHGTLSSLTSPDSFQEMVPDGGCEEACSYPLPCGHACPKKCHPTNPEHKGITCKQQNRTLCPNGHPVVRICSQQGSFCTTCQKLADLKAKEEKRRIAEAEKRQAEQNELEVQLLKANLEIEKRKQALQEVQDRIRKEEELKKKQIEQEQIEQEIKIKKEEEQAIQAQKIAELKKKTEAALVELHKDAEAKLKQEASKIAVPQQPPTKTNKNEVNNHVDALLAMADCVDANKLTEFAKIVASLSPSDRTLMAESLVPKVGPTVFDWLEISQLEPAPAHAPHGTGKIKFTKKQKTEQNKTKVQDKKPKIIHIKLK
jgi:hypothetical protein